MKHFVRSLSQALKRAFMETFCAQAHRAGVATAWDSMVAAASEEWGDGTVFQFRISLPKNVSNKDFVTFMLDRAVTDPDLDTFRSDIATTFGLNDEIALEAIDRALGGVARAASLNPLACPDDAIDPVGAGAFRIASANLGIISAIYPGWQTWKPGVHSKSL